MKIEDGIPRGVRKVERCQGGSSDFWPERDTGSPTTLRRKGCGRTLPEARTEVRTKIGGKADADRIQFLNHERYKIVYSGPGIQPQEDTIDRRYQRIIQYFLGRDVELTEEMDRDLFKALFISENHKILEIAKKEIGIALAEVQLPPKSEAEEKLLKAFVGNLIAVLPFCYPKEGDTFVIPMKVEEGWKKISYTIDRKINLAPDWYSPGISAYGLVSEEGPPLLTFLGTTFPAGEGFVETVLSDCTPGMSVGHAPYLLGKKKIDGWMKEKKGVHLYGLSLGGALAFHALRYHRAQIEEVSVYNPAGLYFWNWSGEKFDEGAKIHIYCQKNDVVPLLGRFPSGKNVNLYQVEREEGENFLKAHARVYTGGKKVTLKKGDVDIEHSRWDRKAVTTFHFIASFVVFPLLFCCFLIFSVVNRIFQLIRTAHL